MYCFSLVKSLNDQVILDLGYYVLSMFVLELY